MIPLRELSARATNDLVALATEAGNLGPPPGHFVTLGPEVGSVCVSPWEPRPPTDI